MPNTQSWKQKIPGLHNYSNKLLEHIKVIPKVSLSSSCLFGSPFTPYPHPLPLFQWYTQSKDILINLNMKCWFSAFNARGSRLIIVVVQLGAVKINVAVEAFKEKGKTGRNSVYYQNWWVFFEFHPPLNANVLFFAGLFLISPCMTKLRVPVLCFSYFTDNSIV
jgi:hypothetical protein